MTRGPRNLVEGAATPAVGLVLWLTTGDVDVPVVTLTKVGLVLMCLGGAQLVWGLYRTVRSAS
ncbi:DUF5708 family protein [Streptomyces sp. HMX87]|uniref:DUF5708 family protein n=1 Tax=Streptomyces sp. HMX87 TaxID=3390849 RepID=UPI003A8A4FC7